MAAVIPTNLRAILTAMATFAAITSRINPELKDH